MDLLYEDGKKRICIELHFISCFRDVLRKVEGVLFKENGCVGEV